jgi:nucleotide-binding universal stress UspA family protein
MQALQTVNSISFKNILFLTDFSEASETALAYAMGFARHFGAQVYPAHACDPVILTETAAPNILDEVEENSRQRLAQLAKNIPSPARSCLSAAPWKPRCRTGSTSTEST